MDFTQTTCPKKCIPNEFFYGKNYITPFCENWDEDYCARNIAKTMIEITEKESRMKTYSRTRICKHSCNILQYSGVILSESMLLNEDFQEQETMKDFYEQETMNVYKLNYDFGYGDNAPPHQVPKLLAK